MNSECAILVCSCDAYEDAWIPFFTFFQKYWNNCPYKIYFNTETKKCCINGLEIATLNSFTKNETWSLRLKNCLLRIKEKYIIILLEDFFLLDYVRAEEISKCLLWMNKNKNISTFCFQKPNRWAHKASPDYPGYSLRSHVGRYWLNCQAGIWRKRDLTKYINVYENAWQFEEYGTEVAKLYNKEFYIINNDEKPVFNYNYHIETGYGICKGKWLYSNMKLFRENGITTDFSKMGIYKPGTVDTTCFPAKKSLKEKLMYILHGSDEKAYMSITEQIVYLFKHPRSYYNIVKKKLRYFFDESYRG